MTVTTSTLESIERNAEYVGEVGQCRFGLDDGYLKTGFISGDGANRLALFLTPAGREALKYRRMLAAGREIIRIVRRMIHDDLTVQHPGSDTVRRLVELLREVGK